MNNTTPAQQQECFDKWMADYLPVLHHVARAFAAPADHDDLIQEILLAVWKAIPYYKGTAKPSTFIYKVSHNAALTWRRTEKRRTLPTTPLEDLPHLAAAPEIDREAADRLEELCAAIRTLPE